MRTTPQRSSTTLPPPWCCRVTRRSTRQETLVSNTETTATTVQSLPESSALAPDVTQSAHAYWSSDGLLGSRGGPFSSGAWPRPCGRRLLPPRTLRVFYGSPRKSWNNVFCLIVRLKQFGLGMWLFALCFPKLILFFFFSEPKESVSAREGLVRANPGQP